MIGPIELSIIRRLDVLFFHVLADPTGVAPVFTEEAAEAHATSVTDQLKATLRAIAAGNKQKVVVEKTKLPDKEKKFL